MWPLPRAPCRLGIGTGSRTAPHNNDSRMKLQYRLGQTTPQAARRLGTSTIRPADESRHDSDRRPQTAESPRLTNSPTKSTLPARA